MQDLDELKHVFQYVLNLSKKKTASSFYKTILNRV